MRQRRNGSVILFVLQKLSIIVVSELYILIGTLTQTYSLIGGGQAWLEYVDWIIRNSSRIQFNKTKTSSDSNSS